MQLTLPQQDIYYEQLLYPSDPIYNIGAKIRVKGKLDVIALQQAYDELIQQHDAYRIKLKKNDESISINIQENHDSKLGLVDFTDQDNPQVMAEEYMQKEFTTVFDVLDENFLHKFVLIKVKEDDFYLFSVYHHIITDGWGTSLMFQRWVQNYNEIMEFGAVQTKYPYSYKDFALNDLEYQNSKDFEDDKKYWVEKFKNLPENLLEKVADDTQNKSRREVLTLSRIIYNQLDELAKSTKTSTFHLILAALYLYFSRKHHNKDFAIGLPVLNRSKSVFKKTVGLFMGVTALRIKLDSETSFMDLVQSIKTQLRQDYRHQRFPLGKLIQELKLFSKKERLFNITLSYEKQNYKNDFLNTKTKVIPMTHQSERVALAMYVREFDATEDVHIDFDYNLNYFDESTISEVVLHFENLIHEIIKNPSKKLREINFLSPNEEKKILLDFNKTEIYYDTEKTFLNDFEDQVTRLPNARAVFDDSKSYTYKSISSLSNKIAAYFSSKFVNQDKQPIAVMMNRSADMLALLLGIMKSGRAYIPLDPIFPKDRLLYILKNSEAKLLISTPESTIGDVEGIDILMVNEIMELSQKTDDTEAVKVEANDLAYIIYTSGSTGNPKGVKIGHRSLYNFLLSIKSSPGIEPIDTLFSVTTYSFDISILEFFVPLISGASVYIADNTTLSDPIATIDKIHEINPSIIQGTPSFYQMLFNAGWISNNKIKVMCGGDLLSESLAEKLIENSSELWNMYGPTECTIWSSIKKIEHPKEASTIGKPIDNTQFYILDAFMNPMPIGAIGNIYIGGDGLAIGYHKKTELTAEKFVTSPFDQERIIYETGDLGKWNRKGEIAFLGRNDNQVKIRGYRIELGDIESRINLINEITNSVVIAKKGNQQEDFLVAYIIASNAFNRDHVIKFLSEELPEYMIPYAIVELDEFPLTPNNKIDRKKLAQRDITINSTQDEVQLPTGGMEIQIASYWREILQVDTENQIDVNTNFFAFGGNSLNAVKLIGCIHKDLSIKINLKTIFDYPTIATLSTFLENQEKHNETPLKAITIRDYYEITPSQYSIWLASQHANKSIAYNMAAAYQIEGVLDTDKIRIAINQSLKKHEILRTNFIEIDGKPYQKIHEAGSRIIDLKILNTQEKSIHPEIEDFISRQFDLETDHLLRVKLFQPENSLAVLAFCTHHIILDGWSMEILIQEIIQAYNNLVYENNDATVELKLQFKDYAHWHLKKTEESYVVNKIFWETQLLDYQYNPTFERSDFSNSDLSFGADYTMEVSKDLTKMLKALAQEHQTTIHNILMTALNVLIYKISGHDDTCIGTVNFGRENIQFTDHLGMFVKTLPLRTKINEKESFANALNSIEKNLLQIDAHQDLPKEYHENVLYDVLLVYQNKNLSYDNINELKGVNLKHFPIQNKYSRLPMSFNFSEQEESLKADINYNSKMYQAETVQIIAYKFISLLEKITNNFLVTIEELDLRLEIESDQEVDFDFNF